MTYANTTLLGLNQPTTGSESGVWGDDVNNGFTQLVDLAVAGTNNITQDSDITLAVSNGSNSSSFTSTATNSTVAQYAILNCTGSRTAARNIIAPASSKTFLVINNTTGGYAITIKKSAGTGVSVAVGEKAYVYYDIVSGDYAKGTTNTTAILPASGYLISTVTNMAANPVTGTPSSSNFLRGDGTWATVTGTVPSPYTANGLVYASSTSALATGSALTWNGTTLGLPSGSISLGLNTSGQYIDVINGDSTNAQRLRLTTSGTDAVIQGTRSSGTQTNIIFKIDSSEYMRLTSSGYLGIGTSSPSSTLEVSNAGTNAIKFTNSSASISTYLGANSSNSYIGTPSNVALAFTTNDTERMRLDTSGNLGLGVTPSTYGSSSHAIEIGFGGTAGAIFAYSTTEIDLLQNSYWNGGFYYKNSASATRYYQGGGQHQWFNAPSGTAGNAISFTQAMTLDNSGNLAIGTTTTTAAQLTVNGSASIAGLKVPNIKEVATVSATAATGTINYDITTQSVLYYTSNASANFTLNFRASSGTSLNTLMSTGESMTVVFMNTNGSTAYYASAFQIDGTSVTPKWQGGTAPSSGNASSIDTYTFTIIKTASATYTVLASQTKFA